MDPGNVNYTRRQLFARSRNWLLASGIAGLFPGLTLFPKSAGAADAAGVHGAPPFFLMLRAFGGLDSTLGLEPYILPAGADAEDLFLEYRPEDIVSAAGLKLGPAAQPLVGHAADLLVLNGIQMRSDAGHDTDNLYLGSGKGDYSAPSFAVELAACEGEGPFGVVVDGFIHLANRAVGLSQVADLAASNDQNQMIEFIEERLRLRLGESGTPFERAQEKIVEGKAAAARFVEILKELRAQGIDVKSPQIAAAAFAAGGARQGALQIPVDFGALDSHAAHEKNHLRAQTAVWTWVADVFATFKKIRYGQGTLFDATTFMVFSEFSRTPYLNPARGKDHNPYTNSMLLAGAGIAGGTVVGASRLIPRTKSGTGLSDLIARPFNYATGELATEPKGASFIFPENVIRTLALLFGDSPQFSSVSRETAPVPHILKLDKFYPA